MDKVEIDSNLPHYEVRVFLADRAARPRDSSAVARLLSLPEGPAYASDLNAIVAAITDAGLWWHMSHLGVDVTPNQPVKGMEGLLSNAAAYDREGHPISYHAMLVPEDGPAWALCEAWIKAAYDLPAAFYVVASARQEAHDEVPMSRHARRAYDA